MTISDQEINAALQRELKRQRETINLIASENLASKDVLRMQGSVFTNKYAEGYPEKRYYGGCFAVDEIETIAIERVKKLFNAKFANVQPHSGSQANFCAFLAVLKPGDTVLGLNLLHGGHLTHGSAANVSGKWFNIVSYNLDENGFIDYGQIEKLAIEHKPKLIISGASAYSRIWNWEKIGSIAKSVGGYHLADIAHYAGLIAAGIYPSPIEYADMVTSTTHKTLQGTRGGFILTNDEQMAKKINSAVFPGTQGGPLPHIIAAKAITFGQALKPEFRDYQKQVLLNAKKIAEILVEGGLKIIAGGTDCHLLLADLRPLNITGLKAQEALEKAGITLNKNAIPYDDQKLSVTSGIRIGSPTVTARGMKEGEMIEIAQYIMEVLRNIDDESRIAQIRKKTLELCARFPIYEPS